MKKEETATGLIPVSKEAYEQIKVQYAEEFATKKLRKIDLPMDDNETRHLEVVVRIPDRHTTTQFMRFISDAPKKAQELLVNQCLLTSKEEVLSDDNLFFACAGAIAELFPIRQAKVKNF